MIERRENTDNECQRNSCGAQDSDTLSEQTSREQSLGVLRQLNQNGLAEQARRGLALERHKVVWEIWSLLDQLQCAVKVSHVQGKLNVWQTQTSEAIK